MPYNCKRDGHVPPVKDGRQTVCVVCGKPLPDPPKDRGNGKGNGKRKGKREK